MNRIILIGNGFDLAHNLRTSYGSFIDSLWADTLEKLLKSHIPFFENEYLRLDNPDKIRINGNIKKYRELATFIDRRKHNSKLKLRFKNEFLRLILEGRYVNWVDIENEYYELLIKIIDYSKNRKSNFQRIDLHLYSIDKLNKDFEQIKNSLIKYLKEVSMKSITLIPSISDHIFSHFDMNDFSQSSFREKVNLEYKKVKGDLKGLENEFIDMSDLDEDTRNIVSGITSVSSSFDSIKKKLLDPTEDLIRAFQLTPKNILFLNFNYTQTLNNYLKEIDTDNIELNVISIHGSLEEINENPIIFGFGDEIHEDYSTIENYNDNRYLKNIKSINYLQTDNYKQLLEYISVEKYQVFIVGHSCGISDRTLLNTIFEHNNCSSIKVFYHRESVDKDNFTDIVQNISRNFKDKMRMRDLVVNKKYCKPLVEIID